MYISAGYRSIILKKQKIYSLRFLKSLVWVCFMLMTMISFAQKSQYFPPPPKDTSHKKKIEIVKTDSLLFRTQELGKYRKLIGHVVLKHADGLMYCDSAIIDIDANYMTAYGKQVHIVKGDSIDIWGDFLEYFGDQKLARLTGMCSLRDKTMILTTPELNYHMDTDVGNYMSGGRLVNKETVITSAIGYYYHQSSDAVFYGDVVLKDPNRTIYADSLRYNTDKEIAYFITKTKIIDKDSNIIETNSGYYDTKKEKAFFGDNAIIHKDDSYVKATSIDYDNDTKQAVAQGNVVYSDSSERTTILSNYIYSNEDSSTVKAFKDPLMMSVSEDEKDTLYLSADTLLTFKLPVTTWTIATDSTGKMDSIEKTDSIKIVKAYYHMKLIQGEVSATADSLFYSEKDSTFKLYNNPIMWMDSTQITGDSIYLYTKNKEINKIDIFNNAFIVNMQDSTIFNQTKGKFMQAFIEDKKMTKVDVDGNAESIYYIKDDDAYTGANKSTSGYITVSFEEGDVNRIKLTGTPEAEFTPMKKLNPETFRLEGFVWHWDKKPMTIYDVIRDRNQFERYMLENKKVVVKEPKPEEKREEKVK
ncbi:MAG: OstA family protein [Bacteroidota bacterium]|nr:OstA family protein [Bacteroidota bacterium]